MNLYLVSQSENNDYDTYDAMAVAASSPDAVTVELIGISSPLPARYRARVFSPRLTKNLKSAVFSALS